MARNMSPAYVGNRTSVTTAVPVQLLTQQGVHVSLGVVEEASFPTDQIQGVHQVRATKVLWRCDSLGTGPRYNQQDQQRDRLEPQSRHAGRAEHTLGFNI